MKGEVNSTSTNESFGEDFIKNDEKLTSGRNFLIFSTGSCTVYSDRKGIIICTLCRCERAVSAFCNFAQKSRRNKICAGPSTVFFGGKCKASLLTHVLYYYFSADDQSFGKLGKARMCQSRKLTCAQMQSFSSKHYFEANAILGHR